MKDRIKAVGMATIAFIMLPFTLLLITIGYLWGHARMALNIGVRTAVLGSLVNALEEEEGSRVL